MARLIYSAITSLDGYVDRGLDAAAIRRLKESSRADITIGGAELAGQAIAEGLVDECHLFVGPVIDERRFRSGVVYLHYRL